MSNTNRKRKHSDNDEKVKENHVSKKQSIETPDDQEPKCPIDLCFIPPVNRISIDSGGISHVYNTSNLLKHIEEDSTVRDPLTRIKYTPNQLQSVRVAAKALGEKVCVFDYLGIIIENYTKLSTKK